MNFITNFRDYVSNTNLFNTHPLDSLLYNKATGKVTGEFYLYLCKLNIEYDLNLSKYKYNIDMYNIKLDNDKVINTYVCQMNKLSAKLPKMIALFKSFCENIIKTMEG